MLEARYQQETNEPITLSIQHAMDCSVQNQGCDGGYPYLVEKFG